MDNDGKRLIGRYYNQDFPTVREQKVLGPSSTCTINYNLGF